MNPLLPGRPVGLCVILNDINRRGKSFDIATGEMSMDTVTNSWQYFDKIYCISLQERPDRQNEARIQFEKVGLSHKVEFVAVEKHPHNTEKGIYEAHMACIRNGVRAGADNIVIFEDDIFFERFSREKLKCCIDFLSAKTHWNILFFGCLVSGSKRTKHQCILKIKYRSLAHAYVLNRPFAEALLEMPWRGIAFDDVLRALGKDSYAVYPSFAFQSNSPTSNHTHLYLDRFRRLFGGLRRIQKWNEYYCRHKMLVIALHLLVIALIVIAIF
jgi:chloramphenicol 3-O-phosphotransferase